MEMTQVIELVRQTHLNSYYNLILYVQKGKRLSLLDLEDVKRP